MPPLPPPLVDDLVEEVLLRFPPEDPAALVRATLVCKRWRRLISGPVFRRRYREFHRTPPMLGVFCWYVYGQVDTFLPSAASCPRHAERARGRVLDARHGRVLFRGEGTAIVVWDPITDEEWKVPFPPYCTGLSNWTAAVLCSTGGCGHDHLDCHRQPFNVVFVGSVFEYPQTFIYTYSSNAAVWSGTTCVQRSCNLDVRLRSALVGNTIYFGNLSSTIRSIPIYFGNLSSTILKYNMQLRQMSWIELPSSFPSCRLSALTATEDGGLRIAVEDEYKLHILLMKDTDEVDTRWEQDRVIKLNTLLPVDDDLISLDVVGFTDDLGTIFVSTDNVSYSIDLKTYKVKKVYEGRTNIIVPYMSFYTPALEADGMEEEGRPSAGAPSA